MATACKHPPLHCFLCSGTVRPSPAWSWILIQILCTEYNWLHLPLSVSDLRCSCDLPGLRYCYSVLRNLHSLVVLVSPCGQLVDLMRHAPRLQALALHEKEKLTLYIRQLYNTDGLPASDFKVLQHQLSTMSISCPSFMLRAHTQGVVAVMAWLRPIPSTHLTLEVWSLQDSPRAFLRHVANVFPNLTTLELMDVSARSGNHPYPTSLSEDFLQPLIRCKYLKELCLHLHFVLTSAGLAELCLGLPVLEKVKCYRCEGLDYKEVGQRLLPERPHFRINFFRDP